MIDNSIRELLLEIIDLLEIAQLGEVGYLSENPNTWYIRAEKVLSQIKKLTD